MKVRSAGKHLWQRTIASTVFGEAIDTVMFVPLAFWNSGIIPNDKIPLVIGAQIISRFWSRYCLHQSFIKWWRFLNVLKTKTITIHKLISIHLKF